MMDIEEKETAKERLTNVSDALKRVLEVITGAFMLANSEILLN